MYEKIRSGEKSGMKNGIASKSCHFCEFICSNVCVFIYNNLYVVNLRVVNLSLICHSVKSKIFFHILNELFRMGLWDPIFFKVMQFAKALILRRCLGC